ncbi:hypothetical protein [Candidatus Rariloculus sp.]|uniref:hypothetical protein n=1 Tax=Candidatus Rariloculus sp. TaxID=3101265 RepID=UPI003D1202A6
MNITTRNATGLVSIALLLSITTSAEAQSAANLAEAYGEALAEMPDWSGIWNIADGIMFPGPEHAVYAEDPAGEDGGLEFGPLPGSYITGVPYKPEYQAIYDEKVERAAREFYVDDPVGGCMLPHGMPRVMGGAPGPIEIVQTPKITYMIWDYMNELRRIHTDGRSHPGADLSWPMVMGHSIGRWEGGTLVVDSRLMPEGQFDRTGAPHSDQVHLMERIRMQDDGRLRVDMVIEDPVMFTGPWEVTRYLARVADQQMTIEGTYCENQRNPHDAEGNQSATLPGAN